MEFHYYTISKWKNVKQTHAPTYFTLIKNLGMGYMMKLIAKRIDYSNFAITKTQRSYFCFSFRAPAPSTLFFPKEFPKPVHSLGKRIKWHAMKTRNRNFVFWFSYTYIGTIFWSISLDNYFHNKSPISEEWFASRFWQKLVPTLINGCSLAAGGKGS